MHAYMTDVSDLSWKMKMHDPETILIMRRQLSDDFAGAERDHLLDDLQSYRRTVRTYT